MNDSDFERQLQTMAEILPVFVKGFHVTDQKGLAGLDITISQCLVLNALGQSNNYKMTDLARALGVTMGNATGVVDRLVRDGLVKRIKSQEDRRIVRIYLTQKGKETVAKIKKQKIKNIAQVLNKITKKDRGTLLNIMKKVARVMQKERALEINKGGNCIE